MGPVFVASPGWATVAPAIRASLGLRKSLRCIWTIDSSSSGDIFLLS